MPTYLYETLPSAGIAPRRFEVRQSFDEPALTIDPETGEQVRRVISGGLGILTKGEGAAGPASEGCGPANCHCGRFS